MGWFSPFKHPCGHGASWSLSPQKPPLTCSEAQGIGLSHTAHQVIFRRGGVCLNCPWKKKNPVLSSFSCNILVRKWLWIQLLRSSKCLMGSVAVQLKCLSLCLSNVHWTFLPGVRTDRECYFFGLDLGRCVTWLLIAGQPITFGYKTISKALGTQTVIACLQVFSNWINAEPKECLLPGSQKHWGKTNSFRRVTWNARWQACAHTWSQI